MDHVRGSLADRYTVPDERRREAVMTFHAWCLRRRFTVVKYPEFWYTQARFCCGWFRATVRLSDGTERRVYDGGGSPEGWRMGNPRKKKVPA